MDQELLPLSEAKTRLHELLKDTERPDLILLRYGRPVGALLGYQRYRELLAGAERGSAVRAEVASPAEALGIRAADLARICRSRGVKRLVLFGSAARGDAEPSSDIDLLVEFAPMPPAQRAEAFFGLQENLERLLDRTVDLLEEAAVRNPYLMEAIGRDRTVLFEAA